MLKNNLLSFESIEKLKIEDVQKIYVDHINSAQVDILKTFSFGRTLLNSASGEYLTTEDGRKIFDATVSAGVMGLGHNNERILNIRKKFCENKSVELQKLLLSRYQAGLAHNLAKISPGKLSKCFFCNSGSESVEGALKLAYKYHEGKRSKVLVSDIAFHGNLLGSGGLTSRMHKDFSFPTISGIEKYIYGDIESVIELVKKSPDDIYAIMIEPVSASSMLQLSNTFLRKVRDICDKYKIVLICDEIYTGMGKTGNFYAFEKSEIIPDIVTISKTLGGGKASISCFLADTSIFKKAYENMNDAYLHSTTYQGMGEECVTAIEAINIIVENNYLERVREIESLANFELEKLREQNEDKVSEIRSNGSMFAIVLKEDLYSNLQSALSLLPVKLTKDKAFIKKLYLSSVMNELFLNHNILLSLDTHRSVPLVISFPYIVTDENIKLVIESINTVLQKNSVTLISKFIKNKVF